LEDEFDGENFEEEEFDEDQDVEGEDFKQQWNSILVNLYQVLFDSELYCPWKNTNWREMLNSI
jgi:hypothetical protein